MHRHMWKNNKFGLRIYYKGIVKKQNEVERMLYEFLKGTMQVNQFTIYDCINATDQWLESTHNYIQWCFPNHKQSSVSKNAPILTDNELNKILNDEICVSNIKSMTNRMIQFYDNNPVKSSFNHNCKRITRILLFLKEIDENEFSIDSIAKKRNWIIKGNEPDIQRCSQFILTNFRDGKIGKFTLEKPTDF